MNNFKVIEDALQDGGRLHGFRSGGGLRVIRIEKDGDLVGYGEHPSSDVAFSHVMEDYSAGGREYKEVYGGSNPHYLTGSCGETSPLDEWILKGGTIDARWDEGFVVELRITGQMVTPPEHVMSSVLEDGVPVRWERRGYIFEARKSSFSNGEPCCSCSVIKSPEGKDDPWMYDIVKTGLGESFQDALVNSIDAEEAEEDGDRRNRFREKG